MDKLFFVCYGVKKEERLIFVSNNEKVNIYQILDMFNEEVGYIGLDNSGKTTDERDDIITRKTFNNWIAEYNKTHPRKIKGKKIDQFIKEYFKTDIEKLIETPKIQKRLKDAYLRETEPLFKEFESIGYTSKRVSKRYKEKLSERQIEGFEDTIKSQIYKLIDEVIENHFTLKFNDDFINVNEFIDKNKIISEFIDLEKIEAEAIKIEDGFYGIPEYDSSGDIVAVHHMEKRKQTKYFLKNKN